MEARHRLFLMIATGLLCVAIALELGAGLFPPGPGPETCVLNAATSVTCQAMQQELGDSVSMKEAAELAEGDKPPGYGVRSLAMFDVILLATVSLIAAHLWLAPAVISRVQGVVMLVSGLIVLCWSFTSILKMIALVVLMVGLFLAPPFGTAFYLATYGFFDIGTATAVLSLVMLLKLGFCVCLILAHLRYLTIKSLVLMAACSLLTTFIVALLQGIVPVPLVSITDGVAAIVVAVIALVWSIYAIIGGAKGVIKAIA